MENSKFYPHYTIVLDRNTFEDLHILGIRDRNFRTSYTKTTETGWLSMLYEAVLARLSHYDNGSTAGIGRVLQ